ncbi:hypothetical protein TRIP_D440115 [uncultured Paludibacter sp.]|uniref:Uncharacterized protein n=1 Tax=uncultured Paludibacter sp. TaxID=497635 RepID=A0A653AJ43_9BACT|nr:hypothetical protein TRIP_D440115 [uncultured Paludibacter sp.]
MVDNEGNSIKIKFKVELLFFNLLNVFIFVQKNKLPKFKLL